MPNFSSTLTTESDVRLKVIDDVLQSVLGWGKEDIQTEERAGTKYLDYKLSSQEVARVVIEAKRAARSFGLIDLDCANTYKLSGPALNKKDLKEGIYQAIEYSAYKGCELACVTNGYEWVVFRSNRIGDGLETLSGKAFVFSSLECIKNSFRIFFDLLSKERVLGIAYRGYFQEAEGKIIRHSSFVRSLYSRDTARFLPQDDVIPSLDKIMTAFFQRLSDEHDSEMVEYCFVETKESQAAEQRLLRLAEELVGHIRALDTKSGEQLSTLLEYTKSAGLQQFILIVGTKGSGKSTFIRRFFRRKLPPKLSESFIPIIVNLVDSDGDEDGISDWMRRNALAKAEAALGSETPSWDELIGHMFFGEYQRWAKGTMSHLHNHDKEAFKIEFGKHIEAIRQNDPLEYLRGLLRNFVKGRNQIPCLVFDNADHFSIGFQEKVFSFAHALYEQELCVVIMPITDKTSWQLSSQGVLHSFENEALLLPTPSAKRVLDRRINFVLKKMEESISRESGSYFIGKGIQVSDRDLVKFINGLQEIFLNSDKTSYILGQLANHNVRDVLELTRNIVNSPHMGLDKIFKAYVLKNAIHIPYYVTDRALIRGRYNVFVQDANKYVHNVFNLNAELLTTPLLGIRILQALKDAIVRFGETKDRYISKIDLISYLTSMGIERRAVILWLDAMLKSALILNYDPTCIDEATATRLEISPSGEQHLYWGRGSWEYISAMAEVTPIFSEEVYKRLEMINQGDAQEKMYDLIGVFSEYLLSEDKIYCHVPDHESYTGQRRIIERMIRSCKRRIQK
ncbi:MAG: AAA family ATPase [Blastocatellales bacterium]